MKRSVVDFWEKIDAVDNKDEKEKLYPEFFSFLAESTFWLEYKESDGKTGLVFTSVEEEGLGDVAFAYVSDNREEPPALLSEAIASGQTRFCPLDGVSLLVIARSAGSGLVITENEDKNVHINKDEVALLLPGGGESEPPDNIKSRPDWSVIAFLVLSVIILGVGYYFSTGSSVAVEKNYETISWRAGEIAFHNGDFSVAIPYKYEVDDVRKDILYEAQSGNIFRVYESNDPVFRNHPVNIGFLAGKMAFSLAGENLELMAEGMLSAINQGVGVVSVKNKERKTINGKEFLLIHGTIMIEGREVLLTSAITDSYKGTLFIQVLSKNDNVKEHDYFSGKIINSIKVK